MNLAKKKKHKWDDNKEIWLDRVQCLNCLHVDILKCHVSLTFTAGQVSFGECLTNF